MLELADTDPVFTRGLGHLLDVLDDIGVTGVGDADGTDTEVLTASGSEFNVVTSVVVNSSLREESIVFDLGLTERRTVASEDDKLGLSRTKRLESLLVSEVELTRLHNEGKTGVDALRVLLGYLARHTTIWIADSHERFSPSFVRAKFGCLD